MVDIKDQIKNIHKQNLPSNGRNFGRGKLFIIIGALIITSAIVTSIIIFDNSKKPDLPTQTKIENKSESITPQLNKTEEVTHDETAKESIAYKKQEPAKQEEAKQSVITEFKEEIIHEVVSEDAQTEIEVPVIEELETIEDKIVVKESEGDIKIQESEFATIENEIDCRKVTIVAQIESSKSCDNKATGDITIVENSISGGTAPYQVSIDGGNNFYTRLKFEKLFAKLYPVIIRDKNNCFSEQYNQLVDSKDCSYEYAFAPDKGENWEIPTREKTGNIKIYSKTGQLVFQQIFDFPGIYYWEGRSSAGNELPMGAYMFVLDLDEEDTLVGTVTIVR